MIVLKIFVNKTSIIKVLNTNKIIYINIKYCTQIVSINFTYNIITINILH